MEFTCSNSKCRERLEIADEYAGLNVQCPFCQTTVTVPARPQHRNGRRKALTWSLVALAVAAIGATVMIIFVGTTANTRRRASVDSAKSDSVAKAPPITLQQLLGTWEGGLDGDIKKREALFRENGTGQLRVFIVNASMNGSIQYDFSYQIDPKENLVRLTNDYGGKTGTAELTPEQLLHFRLEQQDCVLARPDGVSMPPNPSSQRGVPKAAAAAAADDFQYEYDREKLAYEVRDVFRLKNPKVLVTMGGKQPYYAYSVTLDVEPRAGQQSTRGQVWALLAYCSASGNPSRKECATLLMGKTFKRSLHQSHSIRGVSGFPGEQEWRIEQESISLSRSDGGAIPEGMIVYLMAIAPVDKNQWNIQASSKITFPLFGGDTFARMSAGLPPREQDSRGTVAVCLIEFDEDTPKILSQPITFEVDATRMPRLSPDK